MTGNKCTGLRREKWEGIKKGDVWYMHIAMFIGELTITGKLKVNAHKSKVVTFKNEDLDCEI